MGSVSLQISLTTVLAYLIPYLRLTHTWDVTTISYTVTRVYWLLDSLKTECLLLGLCSQLVLF
jgi:hypothetical protein